MSKKVDNSKVEVGKYHRNHGVLVAIEEIPPEPVPPQLEVGRRQGLPASDERIVWSSKTGLVDNG